MSLTIENVIKDVPHACQGYCKEVFGDIVDKAVRYYGAKSAVTEFSALQAHSKVPSALNSLKVPVLQLSSEFANSGQSTEARKIEEHVATCKASILDSFIAAKQEEAKYYWDRYLATACLEKVVLDITKRAVIDLVEIHEVESDSMLPDGIKAEMDFFSKHGALKVVRLLEIAKARSVEKERKASRKRQKKAEADVEMSGVSGQTNEKTLEKAVATVLQRREQSRRDQKKQRGNILMPYLSLSELHSNPVRHRKEQKEGRPRKRKTFENKIIEEAANILSRKTKKFKVLEVSSYPDLFFETSLEGRCLFLQTQCRLSVLETLRLRNFGVHKGNGVHLPVNIEYFLAVNLKYIFPSQIDFSLPDDGFAKATDDLRKSDYFKGQEPSFQLPIYLAQQEDKAEDWPEATTPIESGINVGRSMLTSLKSKAVPAQRYRSEPEPFLSEMGVSLKSLKEFMLLNQYMAFITDKNLGLAVVRADWYLDEVSRHLAQSVYKQVLYIPWTEMYDEYFKLWEECELEKSIVKFLSSPGSMGNIPTFHMIPKIHKNPWKVRPIVPMHSFFTTRLAMVVHFYLQPLLERYPWICHSSRSFVADLYRATKRENREWKLWTGDVQSMYTNIRTDNLLEALRGVLAKSSFEASFQLFLLRAVRFLNDNVYFQFGDEIFKQDYGIAMGVACSPTLANLFMGVWEEHIGVEEKFFFYRRYIDDCFILDTGSNKIQDIQVPGLVLDWESKGNIPFLDCEVHLHGQEVCVRPYTKALAHYQYIPWSSAHPLHVKRGLFRTELSRMASLSFKEIYFDEQKKRLLDVFRCRGYPEAALKSWARAIRWREPGLKLGTDRRPKDKRAPIFVPSKYNEVWEQIRLEPIWEEIQREIIRWPGSEPVNFSRMMNSLQRSTNLWDVVRRLNRVILNSDEGKKDTTDYE